MAPDIASRQGKCSIREGLFLVSNSILFQPFVLFFSRTPPENNTGIFVREYVTFIKLF